VQQQEPAPQPQRKQAVCATSSATKRTSKLETASGIQYVVCSLCCAPLHCSVAPRAPTLSLAPRAGDAQQAGKLVCLIASLPPSRHFAATATQVLPVVGVLDEQNDAIGERHERVNQNCLFVGLAPPSRLIRIIVACWIMRAGETEARHDDRDERPAVLSVAWEQSPSQQSSPKATAGTSSAPTSISGGGGANATTTRSAPGSPLGRSTQLVALQWDCMGSICNISSIPEGRSSHTRAEG